MPQSVLLATENRAKQERLAWLLEGLGINVITPAQASLAAPEVEEEGLSHQANALAKAVAWSLAYGGMAIASDGGLLVPALGQRWDNLHTRRFWEGDDLERACELLSRMAHLDGKDRRAYWVEAVALADRGRLLHTLEAQSGEGFIAQEVDEGLIRNGFWVGAVLYFPQVRMLYGNMTPAELQRVGDHWWVLKQQVQQRLQ